MRDWLIILLANVVLFVWCLINAFRRHDAARSERFMNLVREWDIRQREIGYAIAEVKVKPGFPKGTGEATWRNAEGKTHIGKAVL